MDSFELTKYAGAALFGLLLIFGGRVLIEELGHGKPKSVGYKLEVPEAANAKAAGAGTAAPAASVFNAANVATMVATADGGKGEKVLKKCVACHTLDQGGKNKIGPALWGIVDRPIGNSAGFSYSKAMAEKGGNWTLEALAAFLHQPKSYIPGTKMVFNGLKKDADIANALSYLNTLK